MTKIMLAQSIKVCHNEHGRVLTGRVSIHSHLLTIDFQILMPDSVKSLKKATVSLRSEAGRVSWSNEFRSKNVV